MSEVVEIVLWLWAYFCVNAVFSWILIFAITKLIRKYASIEENEINRESVFNEGLITILLVMVWGISVIPVITYTISLWNVIF